MTKSNNPTTPRTSRHESFKCEIFFFLDISKPVSCGWRWKPFIWIEAFSAQRHNATEHRVNMKCAPPSVAFRGSLFDIFYPKSSQRPGRNELGGCRVKGLSAAVQTFGDTRKQSVLGWKFQPLSMLLLPSDVSNLFSLPKWLCKEKKITCKM